MEKKNNVDYFKTMSEADRSLTETAVDWTDKAFEGNDDCAAIARSVGKICNVVLREGEDTSILEGIHAFLFKNGKLDTECSWKSENGAGNLPIWYSTHTGNSGKIFFCFVIRGSETKPPIIVGHTKDVEQETCYELLIHVWDTETGFFWFGDNRDSGLMRIDYLISGNMTDKQNFVENLIAQNYLQKTSEEEEKYE